MGGQIMDSPTSPNAEVSVTLGVDTHKDAHVAVALDELGKHLGALSVPTTVTGYKRLLGWARGFGTVEHAGVAARAVLAGTATGQPKGANGKVEMIRTLRSARRSALKARTQAVNQLRALLITAPEELRSELRGLSTARLVARASRLRPGANPPDVEAATKFALRSVARRYHQLSEEISEHE